MINVEVLHKTETTKKALLTIRQNFGRYKEERRLGEFNAQRAQWQKEKQKKSIAKWNSKTKSISESNKRWEVVENHDCSHPEETCHRGGVKHYHLLIRIIGDVKNRKFYPTALRSKENISISIKSNDLLNI